MRHGKFELEKEQAVSGSRFPAFRPHFPPSLHRIAKLSRIERIRFSSQSFSVPWLMHGTRMAGDRLCKAAVKMFSKCFSNCSVDERFLESLKTLSSYIFPPLTKRSRMLIQCLFHSRASQISRNTNSSYLNNLHST